MVLFGLILPVVVVVVQICKLRFKARRYKKHSVRRQPRTPTFHSPNIEGQGQEVESRICLQEESDEETKGLIQAKQTPTLQGGRHIPLPSSKTVHVVRPLISSNKEKKKASDEVSGTSDQSSLPEYQNTTNFTLVNECHANKEYKNFDVKRQYENIIQSPDKTSKEDAEKGATNTDIDANLDINWFKIFKDLAPMLPVDEFSWKSFAFELFDLCQSRRGLPKDIHNEVKNIENKTSKSIPLAYLEVFQTWYTIMADEATLDHIESSLKILRNHIIMKEFCQIKSNPPKLNRYPQKMDLSDSLLINHRLPEHFIPPQPCFLTYAQHESTNVYDTQNTIAHRRQRQISQFTNFYGETGGQHSQNVLQGPSKRASFKRHVSKRVQTYQGRHRMLTHGHTNFKGKKRVSREVQDHHQMLTYGHTRVKKKVSRENWKMKEKFEATEGLKEVVKQHIKTIRKLLPDDKFHLNRYEYNTFLNYTVDVIMEHNNVTRKVVLSITYKAYEEIAETENGERYLLYCGSPKLNLDRKQYDNLKFYVKHARARVLRELTELDEHGDDIYLFLTYNGKSALEDNQRKESSLKRQTYNADLSGMDISSSSTGDSSSQSDQRESSETNMEDRPSSPRETFTTITSLMNNSETNVALLQEEINSKGEENSHTKTQIKPLFENSSGNVTESCKGKADGVQNDDSDQVFVEQLTNNGQLEARNEASAISVNNNSKDRMQNKKNQPYMDMSVDELMENIDKELECTTYQ